MFRDKESGLDDETQNELPMASVDFYKKPNAPGEIIDVDFTDINLSDEEAEFPDDTEKKFFEKMNIASNTILRYTMKSNAKKHRGKHHLMGSVNV